MDILNTKTLLALGLSGAMTVGTASAGTDTIQRSDAIVAVSSQDIRVTVYDGIATVIGNADSNSEAVAVENELLDVPGIDHVINLITWG